MARSENSHQPRAIVLDTRAPLVISSAARRASSIVSGAVDGMTTPAMRRTRFVCISDTHNYTVSLPKGDVLIHAGDITNQGSHSELSKAVKWLEAADFEAKIVIAGNHDITLDAEFYSQHGHSFHNQTPQSSESCISLLTSSPSITYLAHTSATVRLTSPDGPRTTFKVFGSPHAPRHGLWAFYYDADTPAAAALWDAVPPDADVVVTHTPPRGHRDATKPSTPAAKGPAAGCEALRRALWRVRPRLAVCGHIHDGRGAERLAWDLGTAFEERHTATWTDPGEGKGSKKISLVDLTGKRGQPALDNDGSRIVMQHSGHEMESSLSAEARGRIGRRETCIVNAAIMKSRYPHVGGKEYYKPIVVDVDLPVWEEAAS
ncbi:glycoside hydrolase [Purpureocillium lavendulum]|uniref:Glycoside hydrolase n=1 Tax=Purpureocillium lavendulum TaxID=1247861 RepID=A0AB34FUZ6_9HYPO|nr:glycoside hydrolase [Purpureocillium lavendulum]